MALHEALSDAFGISRSLLFLGVGLSQQPNGKREGRDALGRSARLAHGLGDAWTEAFARIFLG